MIQDNGVRKIEQERGNSIMFTITEQMREIKD